MDVNGNVTKTAPYDHITLQSLKDILPSFTGTISQIPPIFSAIRKGGKQMYKEARKGKTAEDLKLEPRQVEVYSLELITSDEKQLPSFDLDIECGGGTYVRSIIRDIGYKLDTVATMTFLKRTQQGPFTSEDTIQKDDWTPDKIYEAIEKINEARRKEEATKQEDN
jgi:tRNA pseudouridine55 synthase